MIDYYFFINDDRIGKISQVIDKIERIDDQEKVLGMTRGLSVGLDHHSLDLDKFFTLGKFYMEQEDHVQVTLTIADENKENIIYQSDQFHYLQATESAIMQGGVKEYRYVWQTNR